MALTPGTDTWVTLAEANAYFLARWNSTAWTSGTITDPEKEQLLKHAYNWINQQSFFSIDPASTAEIVKQAQCETAWYIYNYFATHEKRRAAQNQGVKSFKIMNFSENYSMAQFPEDIKDMLDDFLTNEGGVFPVIERELSGNNG